MEYNTRRSPLKLPLYGRGVQTMVEQCLAIPERPRRQAFAQRIAVTMAAVTQQSLRNREANIKIWNHLAKIADYKLDIDYPVQITKK